MINNVEQYHQASLNVEVYPHLCMALQWLRDDLPKVAVDIGCGAGRDTKFLLRYGFRVHAYDIEERAINRTNILNAEAVGKTLFTQAASFEQFEYPQVSLACACSSLFFCRPEVFDQAWENVTKAITVGGVFCGHFMGPMDSWAKLERGDLTILERHQVEELFNDFEVIDMFELNESGRTLSGRQKHWHTYSVVAYKKT